MNRNKINKIKDIIAIILLIPSFLILLIFCIVFAVNSILILPFYYYRNKYNNHRFKNMFIYWYKDIVAVIKDKLLG